MSGETKGRHTPTSPRRRYRMAVREHGGAPRTHRQYTRLCGILPEYRKWITADFGRYLKRRRAKNSARRHRRGLKRRIRTLGLRREDVKEWAS